MMAYQVTKDEGKANRTFNWLSRYTADVNVNTLKQISAYVARVKDEFNPYVECKIKFNNSYYDLSLGDGTKIKFSSNPNMFGFVVTKKEDNVSMLVVVSESKEGDLSTANVYGQVRVKDDGMYVVSFRPNDISDDSLKYGVINYYTEDEIEWALEVIGRDINYNFDIVTKNNLIYPFAEKSFFEISALTDLGLDIFDGYLTNAMIRVNLLYDNVKFLEKDKKLIKRKLK